VGRARSFLIVGAGLYGAVCARELADAGHRVQVLEKRDHIGGNCFTRYHPEAGCHQHVYGAHIFHTNSPEIWAYVNRFTAFNSYIHRLHATNAGRVYSFPINLFTLHQVFGVTTPAEAEARLVRERLPIPDAANLEDWCLSQVGRELYELFIRGYTAKQWHKDPRELPASIIKRLPVRTTYDDRYYSDRFQGIPVGGYTAMLEHMLAGIHVELGVDFLADRDAWLRKFDHVIYSGPVDAFFDYSAGLLEYRSLRFEHEMLDVHDAQGIAVMNYTAADVPFTRKLEHKHFDLNLRCPKTLLTTEYPQDWQRGMTEYYPVNTDANQEVFARYEALKQETRLPVTFGGRLGEYRYYDMHQVIAAALATVSRIHQH
jgi:UDP-galactopyranose mutase